LGGKAYRLLAVGSALGQVAEEGCRDTHPSYLLLVGPGKDSREIAWISPKFDEGHIRYLAADVNADGREEIIVSTHWECRQTGHLIVFAPPAAPPATRRSADARAGRAGGE
jgi:hypothetical protein